MDIGQLTSTSERSPLGALVPRLEVPDPLSVSRLRVLLALVAPALAFSLQAHFWSALSPFVFVLFYPAVLLSAWVGGLRGGALATLSSAVVVWWYFMEPRGSHDSRAVVSLCIFVAVGLGASVVQGRLHEALARSRRASRLAEELVRELDARVRQVADQLAASHQAVKSSEARLAGTVESALDAIVCVDGRQRVILFNAAAERLFGYGRAEVLEQPFAQLLPQRLRDAHSEHLTGLDRELVGRRRDGSEFPMEASTSQSEADGEPVLSVVLRDVTAQRQSDEVAARLAAIVESSADAIVGKNLDGVVNSWNDGAARLFGYTASEMIGHSISLVIPLDRLPEEQAILSSIRRGEAVAPFDTVRRRKDGTLVSVAVTASPIRDAQGKVVGASKVARDITQRRQIEESLRRSEARFQHMFDSMRESCAILDFGWRYRYVNESFVRALGAPRAEIVDRKLTDVFPGIEHSELYASMQRCMSQGASERSEYWLDYPGGSRRCVDVSVQPAPEGLFVLGIDISERKSAESALLQSEASFRQIVESLPQLIWTTTASGENDYSGRQWAQYTGASTDQSHRSSWAEFIHPEDLPRVGVEWQASIASGQDFRSEYRIRGSDRTFRWFDSRATAVRDERGQIIKWFGSSSDIDDRRRLQSQHLRTQKMEALGTLAGGIAHDFNNILFAILGNAELGQLSVEAKHPARDCFSEIERASLRARDLVQHILSFSRQDEPRREVLDLRPVVAEALKLLRSTLPAMIVIRSEFAQVLPQTVADASQVHQIVMNLVTNSAHALGDRAGLIEVRLQAVQVNQELARMTVGLSEGPYVLLSVTDDGHGMSEHMLERIFDPFFTTKPVGQGTGLGLSVVDGIMKAHGGAIAVYSALGKGTAFRLYFLATTEIAQPPAPEMGPVPVADGQRILYIDDDQALVLLAERTLSRLGYRVTTCCDPRDALERLRADPTAFDAVVTDLSMPWMSGNELARQLLALRPSLPIVMTSGYVRPQDQAQADQLGVLTVILKPNTIDALARELGRLFKLS